MTGLDRRSFLIVAASATGTLVWGCRRRGGGPASHELTPLVSIASDETVTIAVARTEMGQGVTTALPMLLADELDVDWARVAISNERVDPRNGDQFTAASISVFECWEPYRKAGATARALLVEAAARRWGVPASRLRTEAGHVIDDDRRASYGSLVAAAAALPAPAILRLDATRPPRVIGKPLPRLDTPPKLDGSAIYGIDVRVPDLLFACVARPPRAGATAAHHDAAAALRIDGVRRVVPISAGIAVLADDTWAAKQGVAALHVEWRGGTTASSADHAARLAAELELPMTTIASHGDVDRALAEAVGAAHGDVDRALAEAVAAAHGGVDRALAEAVAAAHDGVDRALAAAGGSAPRSPAPRHAAGPPTAPAPGTTPSIEPPRDPAPARLVTATYRVPFVPHATMEPVNATAHVERGRCTIWAPTQAPHWNRRYVARMLGLREADVEVHRTYAGGGFGRKTCQDFIHDAVEASRAAGRPVQVLYTREDDLQHDYYRPAFAHRMTGAVRDGAITAWDHRLAGPSVTASWDPFDAPDPAKRGAIDELSTAGAETLPYAIPSFRARARMVDLGVRVGIWRSIAHSYTCFANESFVDELAAAAGRDPVDFRLAHLAGAPRARAVLERVAERARWHARGDRLLGVALEAETSADDDYAVHVAHVVELARAAGGALAVARIWVAADAGRIVNPNIAASQLEGGAVWALSALLHEITFAGGAVEQTNFHDLPVLRMPQMPAVEIDFIESTARPSGLGEKGVPSLGPAVANALAAATGRRVRTLPIRPPDLRA